MANSQPTPKWSTAPENDASSSSSPVESPSANDAPWSRTRQSSIRRLSEPRVRVDPSLTGQAQRLWNQYYNMALGLVEQYFELEFKFQIAIGAFLALLFVLGILTILYHKAFFAWLGPVSETWYNLPGGWLIAFAFIFITAFPPVVLYSVANTVAGFVYGFPGGWPIAASACVIGSLCAFIASRTILGSYVNRLVGKDARFIALGQVLRKEGLLYLTAIRFCPLPFSLSNGFLATIPSITPLAFALSTLFSTPKLLVHIFIGSRIALLVKKGDELTFGDKAINILSMAFGGAVGLIVGYAIYGRTMARAAAISREQGDVDAEEGHGGYSSSGNGYADAGTGLMDPEDAAAIMSDDDLSMWGEEDAFGDTDDEAHKSNGR